jgi:hypothetical protein
VRSGIVARIVVLASLMRFIRKPVTSGIYGRNLSLRRFGIAETFKKGFIQKK